MDKVHVTQQSTEPSSQSLFHSYTCIVTLQLNSWLLDLDVMKVNFSGLDHLIGIKAQIGEAEVLTMSLIRPPGCCCRNHGETGGNHAGWSSCRGDIGSGV